ncbi:MAG: CusA/CzcA family heavy metal efflux RND transporter [Rikenellaceae bacterium]|nr:CusA/CzcA family heavy metal efflux RND transporter [Rikenellaceae bacterium]
MLNRIIDFSLRNRLPVLLAAGLICAAGIYTALKMEVDVFPDLNAPTVTVMTEAPGMAPEEVEKLVTFQIETALNGAENVRRVRSSTTTGFSVVWVEFDWGTDIYRARQIVSEKLSVVSESLPPGAGQPVMGPQSSILGEVLIIGLTPEKTTLQELRTIADRTIRPRLLATGGVAQVSVMGGEVKEFQIVLSPGLMNHYSVSLDEVMEAAGEMGRSSAGGIIYQWDNEYIVRGITATTDTIRLAESLVKMSEEGYPITFGDIARVGIGNKSPRLGTASVEGTPSVLLTVTKQPGINTLELTRKLEATIAEIGGTLPCDIRVSTEIFRQSEFIESSIGNIRRAILEGSIFVILILLLFLMNGRVTVISLIALPLSLLITIIVLRLFGITINTMSLGGMAIAIGSLVDDAIIDVENVFKRLRENHARPPADRTPALRVVYEASAEIRTSIVNATIITIVAFLPLFFLGGMEGRMLRPLGVSFIVALLASLLVAMTVTPVMCSYMLAGKKAIRKNTKEPPVSAFLKYLYGRALQWTLRFKGWVIVAMALVLAGSVFIFTTLGSSFLPPFNEGSLTINVSTLPGVSLDASDEMGRTVERILLEIPEIRTVARKTGRAELDEHALGVNASEIEAPFELIDRPRSEFMADVRQRLEHLAGVSIEIGQPISHRIDAMLSGTKANIAVKLFGDDLNTLYSTAGSIRSAIEGIDALADLNVEQQIERAQLQIIPKREMLARYGITVPRFSAFIDAAISGAVVSQVYDGVGYYDLTVKMDQQRYKTIEGLHDVPVDGADGVKVPLGYVADIVSTAGPNTINRENVKRKVVVSANMTGGDLGGAVAEIKRRISDEVVLPEGYWVEYGGQFESRQAASRILTWASVGALLLIFLLLLREFRKVSLAAMVMIDLPLALVGGVAAVWITSGVVSIPAIIGFISLLGIAVRNGILLVSRYGQLRAQGLSVYKAVIQGSCDRLNPILMTSLTSALALIPLALGSDVPGNEIQSPMAQVILGGLVSSTVLNGFVVPAVYLTVYGKNERDEKNR